MDSHLLCLLCYQSLLSMIVYSGTQQQTVSNQIRVANIQQQIAAGASAGKVVTAASTAGVGAGGGAKSAASLLTQQQSGGCNVF